MHAPDARRRLVVFLALAGLALSAWIAMAPSAYGDEIIVVDLNTGEESRLRAHEITSETWGEVKYIDRPKSRREKSVPTLTVVEIRRSDRGPDAQALAGAMADLSRGNYKEAETAFQNVCGGGYRKDEATDERVYTSFSAADPDGKRKRPNWTSEYAHYHYVKALLERAKNEKDVSLFREVLMALVDEKLESIKNDEGKLIKRSTGGFLDRFSGGNSRFYPHAMLAKAEALVGMGDYAEAQKAYDALVGEASKPDFLHPRWLYEGLIGKGVIAHAQSKARDAELAFENASSTMIQRLGKEKKLVLMQAWGRMFSQGRTRVAEARLSDAEKRNAPSAFKELRKYIQAGSPESLRSMHGARLNSKALKALVAGARDPQAQAVGLNGTGLAYMAEKKFDEALMAFKAVAVKYYGDPDQTSRAYFYMAKAAEAAAKAAKNDETKKMYSDMKDEARSVLRTQFRDTRWARK